MFEGNSSLYLPDKTEYATLYTDQKVDTDL